MVVLVRWRLSGWETCLRLQLYGCQIICCHIEEIFCVFVSTLFKFLLHKGRAGGNSPWPKFLHKVEALLLSKYDKRKLMFEHSSVALATVTLGLQLWKSVLEY